MFRGCQGRGEFKRVRRVCNDLSDQRVSGVFKRMRKVCNDVHEHRISDIRGVCVQWVKRMYNDIPE